MTAEPTPLRRPGAVPQEQPAEESVVGTLLAHPKRCPEVITKLQPEHFGSVAMRMLYEEIVRAYHADLAIDALTVASRLAGALAQLWAMDDQAQAIQHVQGLANAYALAVPPLTDHAALIREAHDRRALLMLADAIRREAMKGDLSAASISANASSAALAIAADTLAQQEIVTFADAGRDFVRTLQFEAAAVRSGAELGVMTAIEGIDRYTNGMRPARLYFFAGEPGAGKSGLWWVAALNYAMAQGARAPADRMGTLVLSMEMGPHDSNGRFAQTLARVDGRHIQQATVTTDELARITNRWARNRDIPLYLNYAPNMRANQVQALVAEAIRKYNIGMVIIDHFRTFDLDKRLENKNDEDEEKARFLKEQIARAMNVAVVCIAHTRKPDAGRSEGRPQMADLRGSGQISAHADMVAFVYRPVMYASPQDISDGKVLETDGEIIYRKNRYGPLGVGKIIFDAVHMQIT